jgi:hypothetical protein
MGRTEPSEIAEVRRKGSAASTGATVGPMAERIPDEDKATTEVVAFAAEGAAADTADAIQRAADKNSDPAVAAVLDEAAVHADKTVARVGWLRRTISRLFGRDH